MDKIIRPEDIPASFFTSFYEGKGNDDSIQSEQDAQSEEFRLIDGISEVLVPKDNDSSISNSNSIPISSPTDSAVYAVHWEDWWSFVKWMDKADKYDYVFRGQSNYTPIRELEEKEIDTAKTNVYDKVRKSIKENDLSNERFQRFLEKEKKSCDERFFAPWRINSSYNRKNNISFFDRKNETLLKSIIDLSHLDKYKSGFHKFHLDSLTLVERLQFVQHYIGDTPLIDFTKDYLAAMYFALNGLPQNIKFEHVRSIQSGRSFNNSDVSLASYISSLDESDIQNIDSRYITIIQINISSLRKDLAVPDISDPDAFSTNCDVLSKEPKDRKKIVLPEKYLPFKFHPCENICEVNGYKNIGDIFSVYNNHFDRTRFESPERDPNYNIFSVLDPNMDVNPNLRLQDGLFIYLDSKSDLESVILHLIRFNKNEGLSSDIPVAGTIIYHHIPYRSCFLYNGRSIKGPDASGNCSNLAAYLMRKNKIGMNLFENDKEGLSKYLHNGSIFQTLKCLNVQNYENCECMRLFTQLGITI